MIALNTTDSQGISKQLNCQNHPTNDYKNSSEDQGEAAALSVPNSSAAVVNVFRPVSFVCSEDALEYDGDARLLPDSAQLSEPLGDNPSTSFDLRSR
jgi:hypothetical protein